MVLGLKIVDKGRDTKVVALDKYSRGRVIVLKVRSNA